MSVDSEEESVVKSILESLNGYLDSKDFSFLFSMGSKLSFVAYTLNAKEDTTLLKVLPALIKFTEIIHKISEDEKLIRTFDDLIVAYLHDLQAWLELYFIDKTPEKLQPNILEVLISGVDNIEILMTDKGHDNDDLDDLFF